MHSIDAQLALRSATCRVRELRGNNPAFSAGSSPASSPATASTDISARQRSTDEPLASPRRAGASRSASGGDEDIIKWHRRHLEELTRLVDEELQLLEKADRGEIKGAKYREMLNDILIDEAMLFSNMPKLE